MNKSRFLWSLMVVILVLGTGELFLPSPVHAQQAGVNLLVNGDFDSGGWDWPAQGGIAEVRIAPGWTAFYLDQPPAYAMGASACPEDKICSWGRPEFGQVLSEAYPERVHSGYMAQRYFSWNRQHEAGLYQQVSGIKPGITLLFTVFMQSWSCMSGAQWNVCPTGSTSNSPAPMHTRVGIDPTGGTNPWASSVVWSAEREVYDAWGQFQVQAVAKADKVTVFTYSRADWIDAIFRISNDIYIDDASLTVVGGGQAVAAAQPQAAPTQQPVAVIASQPTAQEVAMVAPTPTPRPDGTVVYVVQAGDTLGGIAYEYDIPIEQIRELNGIGEDNLIVLGQELVLSKPGGGAAAATPTPETPAAGSTPQTTNVAGGVCAMAFLDRNGDSFRQADEESLAGAIFMLNGAAGLVGNKGPMPDANPACFDNVPAGSYRLTFQPPAGYKASGPADMALVVGGAPANVEFGVQQDASGGMPITLPTPTPTSSVLSGEATVEPSDSEAAQEAQTKTLRIVVLVAGIIMVMGAMGVGIMLIRSRRR